MAKKAAKASPQSKTRSISRRAHGSADKKSKARQRKPHIRSAGIGNYVKSLCVRCRLLKATCDHRSSGCTACKEASVVCFFCETTANDRLFGNLPQNPSLGNRAPDKAMSAGSTQLAKLPAYQEFLEERPVNSAYTSANFSIDAEFVTENPLREQSKSALDFALSGPLKKVIETYPEESAADADFDADSDKERAESSTAAHASSPSMLPLPPLPLPSSDLLDCINKSIMQKEASAEQSGHSLINEHLNGSSLLALGVLLQEYCRYLL